MNSDNQRKEAESEQEELLEHHKKVELCKTRAPYRQGRNLTAVKVYTINDESVYLLIFGVPKFNLRSELKNLCKKYGDVQVITPVLEYPSEEFTECFKVKFGKLQSARVAKKMLDNRNYYGGVLHVCYAPELETVEETRSKLSFRKYHTLRKLQNIQKTRDTVEDVPIPQFDLHPPLLPPPPPILPLPVSESEDIEPKKEYVFKKKRKGKCDISALKRKIDDCLVKKSEMIKINELIEKNQNDVKHPKIIKLANKPANKIIFNINKDAT